MVVNKHQLVVRTLSTRQQQPSPQQQPPLLRATPMTRAPSNLLHKEPTQFTYKLPLPLKTSKMGRNSVEKRKPHGKPTPGNTRRSSGAKPENPETAKDNKAADGEHRHCGIPGKKVFAGEGLTH